MLAVTLRRWPRLQDRAWPVLRAWHPLAAQRSQSRALPPVASPSKTTKLGLPALCQGVSGACRHPPCPDLSGSAVRQQQHTSCRRSRFARRGASLLVPSGCPRYYRCMGKSSGQAVPAAMDNVLPAVHRAGPHRVDHPRRYAQGSPLDSPLALALVTMGYLGCQDTASGGAVK